MADVGNVSALSILRRAALFREVDDDALQELANISRLRRLGKGEILFFQGDQADAFYVVSSGSIHLFLDSADGRELVINEMRAGDGFGELGLITGQPRSTSAMAQDESVVLIILRRDFLAALDSQPALARSLLQTTADRLGSSSEREGALAFLDAPSRLARILLQLDRQASEEGYITISQEELGRRVGLARQTVASQLGKWRRRGWIVTGRGKIVLLDRVALRRQAEGEWSQVL